MNPVFKGLDHLAIVVPDTDAALRLWRDRLGFQVLFSEDVNGGAVRLTHLNLGNIQLQLVEPRSPGHPLQDWLRQHGPGLHHLCFSVVDVEAAGAELAGIGFPAAGPPHQGTQGRRALFLDRNQTQHVQLELTGL